MTLIIKDKLIFERGVPVARSTADRWTFKMMGRMVRATAHLPSPLVASLWKRSRQNWPGKAITSTIEVARTMPANVPVVWLAPQQSPQGVVIALHGGAYVSGPMESQWNWMTEVQKRTSAAMAMVIYRMPPEDPHPAALEDAVNAIITMQESAQLVSGKWILFGDSAGGGLAVAVLNKLIEARRALPAGLLLTAPWVDLAMKNPDLEASEPADGFLHRSWLGWAARLYAGGRSLEDPSLSPLFGSFQGFPSTHINVGTRDLFLPDVRRLKQKLLEANVLVHYIEQEGGIHTYPLLLKTPEAQATIASQVQWIRKTLAI
jgi:acetyl esterase/lipase